VTRVSHVVEYAAARAAIGTLRLLGWRTAAAAGGALARLAYAPFGIRRDVVHQQLRASFPDWSDADIARTARASYDSLGRTSIETAVLAGASRDDVLRMFDDVVGWEHFERATQPGPNGEPASGAILVTGHLGNWELGGAFVAARGIGIDVIVRGMANPLFDRFLTGTRTALGMHVVHDSEAVRRTPRAIREGRLVAMLCDQDTAGLASTFVPFFGRLAKTPKGPAVLSRRLGCPVLFVAVTRLPTGRYRFAIDPVIAPVTGDREADGEAMVAAYTARLEAEVRKVPGQYFWQHKRWKRRPEHEAA
jgi:KDO2-lipid IV(A) lauroyltransferase